jgi:hypothetical protein
VQVIDHRLRRRGDVADTLRERLGAEPIGIEADAFCFLDVCGVLHRRFKCRLQRGGALRRNLRRNEQRSRHGEFEAIKPQHGLVDARRRQFDRGRHVRQLRQPLIAELQQDAHFAVAQPVRLVDGEIG